MVVNYPRVLEGTIGIIDKAAIKMQANHQQLQVQLMCSIFRMAFLYSLLNQASAQPFADRLASLCYAVGFEEDRIRQYIQNQEQLEGKGTDENGEFKLGSPTLTLAALGTANKTVKPPDLRRRYDSESILNLSFTHPQPARPGTVHIPKPTPLHRQTSR